MALCLRMWWRRSCWQKDLRSITLIAKSREKGVFAYLYDYVSGRGNTGTDHISFGFAWIGGSLMNTNYEHIVHPFPPLYDEASKILILGSLPSVKSREQMFFYGHPQNRFWKVMAALTDENVPMTIDEKKELLHKHHIALWDTIYSCDIVGSSDSSIKNVVPTDIEPIINNSKITKIFCNGNTSGKYYKKYQQNNIGIEAVVLPSTSPANAAFSLEKLLEVWQKLIVEACGRSLT